MISRWIHTDGKVFWIVPLLTTLFILGGQPVHELADAAQCEMAAASSSVLSQAESVAKPASGVRPTIRGLCARLYGGYLIVTGTVKNIVGDPTEWTVSLSGCVIGTAAVQADGSFSYVAIYNYSYGEVAARAEGPNGQVSPTVVTEAYE